MADALPAPEPPAPPVEHHERVVAAAARIGIGGSLLAPLAAYLGVESLTPEAVLAAGYPVAEIGNLANASAQTRTARYMGVAWALIQDAEHGGGQLGNVADGANSVAVRLAAGGVMELIRLLHADGQIAQAAAPAQPSTTGSKDKLPAVKIADIELMREAYRKFHRDVIPTSEVPNANAMTSLRRAVHFLAEEGSDSFAWAAWPFGDSGSSFLRFGGTVAAALSAGAQPNVTRLVVGTGGGLSGEEAIEPLLPSAADSRKIADCYKR